MLVVILSCALLIALTTVIHFGPIRLLAGAEALNGLVLVGWSASYAYIAMERFWMTSKPADHAKAVSFRARRNPPPWKATSGSN